jgi:serine protease Do
MHRSLRLAVVVLVVFDILPALPLQAQSRSQGLTFDQFDAAVDALIRRVAPSVVQILVTAIAPQDESKSGNAGLVVGRQRTTGSGFVIDPEGYIVTNAHVVRGAQRVEVILPLSNADGSLTAALSSRTDVLPAQVVGIAREKDIALLKIERTKLPALPLATYTKVRQGQTVFAFGSPEALRNTLTHGVVSAVARQIDPDSPTIYIQTDAPINPGNSGGPLVNGSGEVVGMNTFILSQSGGNEGLGFAIPCATVRTVVRQLKQYGRLRGQDIGISFQTITPTMAAGLGLTKSYGVVISDVTPGGPAETAGVLPGDVLVSVDGNPADDLPSVNYFFLLRESSEMVQLVVLRGKTQQTFKMVALDKPQDMDRVITLADPGKNLVQALGILGVELDKKTVAMAQGLRDPYGVVVAARASGSRVEVPLTVGDVIRTVNGEKVTTLDGLRTTMKGITAGAPVVLQVQREDKLMFVAFTQE